MKEKQGQDNKADVQQDVSLSGNLEAEHPDQPHKAPKHTDSSNEAKGKSWRKGWRSSTIGTKLAIGIAALSCLITAAYCIVAAGQLHVMRETLKEMKRNSEQT